MVLSIIQQSNSHHVLNLPLQILLLVSVGAEEDGEAKKIEKAKNNREAEEG